ncbi:MAG: metalloregulator ArsR/SmtB family transcription factor [Gammaproteobacteria bacterium]
MMKALSDPTRLEILRIVAAQPGPVCACDIVDRFKLSQPTISHHLKTLSKAGLLISRRAGLWSFYTPDPDGLERIDALRSLISD